MSVVTAFGEPRLDNKISPGARNMMEDMSQTSGMILLFGILAFVPAVVDLIGSSAEDVDWNGSDLVFPPIVVLIGNIIRVVFGMTSIFIGFQYTVCRWGSKLTSTFGLMITMAAWFPFAATIVNIIFNADKELTAAPPLVIPPDAYSPTRAEINAIATLGIIGFYGYAGTVIGALTFLHWKNWKFYSGESYVYNAGYYLSRQLYYGTIVIMEGIAQLAFGAFIINNFGNGQLPAPVACGPYFVLFPESSVAIGISHILLGLYMTARGKTNGNGIKDEGMFTFQLASWFVFFASVMVQVVGQVALHTANGPGLFVANVIGFCVWPIYLDTMGHTTPKVITEEVFAANKGQMA